MALEIIKVNPEEMQRTFTDLMSELKENERQIMIEETKKLYKMQK